MQQLSTNDDTQLWSLVPSGAGYVIKNKAGGSAIQEPGGPDGTRIILSTPNGQPNQVWLV